MTEKKEPHERMTENNNGLSSAQEVLYGEEFKRADNAVNNETKKMDQDKKR